MRKRFLSVCMALIMGISLCGSTVGAAAKEITTEETTEEATEEAETATDTDAQSGFLRSEGVDLVNQRLYSGASKKEFKTDGTDEEMPDDEWAELKAKCASYVGQTGIDCATYVYNKCLGMSVRSTDKSKAYLLANGYYQVVERTDLTNGEKFTDAAESTLAKIRRGDILLFSNDAGTYSHIAIADVGSDGVIYLYEAGMGRSEAVRHDLIAYYLSGAVSANDGYGDNIEIFRKTSQKGTAGEVTDEEFENTVAVRYNTHIQNIGWQNDVDNVKSWKHDGATSGTSGQSKRLEAITIQVTGPADLGIAYNTHIQDIGWEASTLDSSKWKKDGKLSGTSGKSKRLEAIQIKLTGEDASKYNVYYRVHAESYGWLGWAKNGEIAGTSGQSKRLEAIQILVLPVGETPTEGTIGYSYIQIGKGASNSDSAGMINYMTHVQDYGDQSYVYDGSISGTSGEAKRLEGTRIKLNNSLIGMTGGVRYITHVQDYGWQGDENNSSTWKADGALAGTSGESKRLEAIKIELYGEVAENYDIYYRVHVENFGWLGWAKNGETSGTTGYSKRLEAIQIVIVPKGTAAPGSTTKSYIIR